MGNRVSRAQILDSGARQPFVYSPLDDIFQLSHPPWQHTLCIADREAKNRHEKKIKLPSLEDSVVLLRRFRGRRRLCEQNQR